MTGKGSCYLCNLLSYENSNFFSQCYHLMNYRSYCSISTWYESDKHKLGNVWWCHGNNSCDSVPIQFTLWDQLSGVGWSSFSQGVLSKHCPHQMVSQLLGLFVCHLKLWRDDFFLKISADSTFVFRCIRLCVYSFILQSRLWWVYFVTNLYYVI